MILFSAEAIFASSTSKFGIEIPRIDDEDLKSSTESTSSTSLIHCIASVGNCEQAHTSVLNLILEFVMTDFFAILRDNHLSLLFK